MNPVEFIMEKRDKKTHSENDMQSFFSAYIKDEIPDYQIAAWLMAAYLNGLNTEEKVCLTKAVINSGDRLDLSHINKPKVDKHSTGGVGDKTSIVLLPLLASLDVCVPMMSGRGLGHTGGTLDKLESIPGMTVQLSKEKYIKIMEEHGAVFMAQTSAITPLDKKLYSLRDVTATVESIPLITASIIGKKMTEDLDSLILDVKFGNGAFMKNLEAARELAQSLVDTSESLGVKTIALITDMNEPLGEYVGNSVEIIESIDMLQGKKVESRFYDVTLRLAEQMYRAAVPELKVDWRSVLESKLSDGSAYEKLLKIINAQGVKTEVTENLRESLPIAKKRIKIKAGQSGYISGIDSYRLGRLMVELKAGRMKITDKIDFGIGLRILKHIGDEVKANEILAELIVHSDLETDTFARCFTIRDQPVAKTKIVREAVTRLDNEY